MNQVWSWEPQRESKLRLALLLVIVACLVFLGRNTILAPVRFLLAGVDADPRPVTPRGELDADELEATALFERVAPSVVFVSTKEVSLQRNWFGNVEAKIQEGTGSGFVWDEHGHIVTNYHVIASADRPGGFCEVYLQDESQSRWRAEIRGTAPHFDLAVLWINAPKSSLQPIPVGTAADLKVGQKAFAIGNPHGFNHTLTAGIVSALHREILSLTNRKIEDVIQVDAAINPGNSGGPLLDSAGRLIGVTTAIDRDAQNIGFAVPVDMVNRVVPDLIEYGGQPGLGIVCVPEHITRRHGIEGVVIHDVFPNGAAAAAGIKDLHHFPNGAVLYDSILEIEGQSVRTVDDIHTILDDNQVGDFVEVWIDRQGKRLRFDVTLQAVK